MTASPCSITGPLAPFAAGFRIYLLDQGYAAPTVDAHLALAAHVSRWLEHEGLGLAEFTPRAAERFCQARRREGRTWLVSLRGVRPLLDFLDELGVIAAEEAVDTPVERLLIDFRGYLLGERGLTEGTARLYDRAGRRFLSQRSEPLAEDLAQLSAADISAFILRESARGISSTKTAVTALRSLLRFLHVEGWIPRSLTSAVPAVAGHRDSSLPRGLEPDVVARLFEACDRDTPVGRRDLAILKVLGRLGLRAQEVADLALDDVRWRTGELAVHGKGSRLERLPLPVDVGEAVVDYLCRARPKTTCRHLFLRSCAPPVGLTSSAISKVVTSACVRAGVPPVGAHRLRHTVASDLLRRGAALVEIGQLLRHEGLSTTTIYAKVDRAELSTLALPWPGGVTA